MFGISMWEVVLIVVVALIVLGPQQLMETAKVVGKVYRELMRLVSDVRNTVDFDSLTSPHQPSHAPHHQSSEPTSTATDQETPKEPQAQQSGPDFYADLLEKSKEEPAPQALEARDEKEDAAKDRKPA
ncbi:MAG: twin-arginine translocase TatA/TatE family subunit [Desulfomonile tiedjei]|nr:twin-arginine translocase TatA/TatE family subunit [Desulfomonile tiedjei]